MKNVDCEKVNRQNGVMNHILAMPDPGRKKPVKELDFQEHKGMRKKVKLMECLSRYIRTIENMKKNIPDSPLLRRETSFIDATDSEEDSETGMVSNAFFLRL